MKRIILFASLWILLIESVYAQEVELLTSEDLSVSETSNTKPPKLKIDKINEIYSFYYDENESYSRRYGILKDGKMLFPQVFRRSQYNDSIENTDLILSVGDNSGLFDLKEGVWTIPIHYSYLFRLQKNLFLVKDNDGNYKLVDSKDHVVEAFLWSDFKYPEEGSTYLSVVDKRSGKTGLLSLNTRQYLVPCEYDQIQKITGKEWFLVLKDNKIGLLNIKNQLIFKKWYDDITFFPNQNIFSVKLKGQFGLIDSLENIILPIENSGIEATSLVDGSFLVQNKNKLYGFVNSRGETLLPFKFSNSKAEGEAMIVTLDNKVGVVSCVNEKLSQIIPCEYENITKANKLFIVKKNGKYGLFNQEGKIITEPVSDLILPTFSNDYSPVGMYILQNGDVFTILDRNGNRINKINYKKIEPFKEHRISNYYQNSKLYYKTSNQKNKYGLIDFYGKEIIPMDYDDISMGFQNYIVIRKNNKEGLYHIMQKKLILPAQYDKIILSATGFFAISGNSFYEIIIDNKVIVKKIY